jgi:hypothetical protein
MNSSPRSINDIAFISRANAISRAPATLLFCIAVHWVVSAGAVRGQSMLDASTPTPTPAQTINFSTRMRVQTDDNVGIAGFIILGTGPKHVLIRALGPSLNQFGISDVLADPTLELRDPRGLVIANDNWKDDPVQRAFIEADGLAPKNDLESAIDWTFFNSEVVTAIVRGKGNGVGVGLIEVYDLNPSATSKLANISTRAFVDTGSNIVIAGFILGNNNGEDRIAVRGIGPSLNGMVTNALQNPFLELRNSQGALVIANDDWQDNASQAMELRDVGLSDLVDEESAIIGALPPGAYTALLSGVNNRTGIGLVEVYDLGMPPAARPADATIMRTQPGKSGAIEEQHVAFDSFRFTGTFRISVYKPSTINHSDIGTRAALQGQTAPISFTASPEEIVAAIEAVTNDSPGAGYYAYGQLGNLEFGPGAFSYFASQGAVNRDPFVRMDPGGTATAGFTIEFGSLVGTPPGYNTWVAGMPLITIAVP